MYQSLMVAVMFAAATSGGSTASAFPGRSLVSICEAEMPDLPHSPCTFYILGVLDGFQGSYSVLRANSS